MNDKFYVRTIVRDDGVRFDFDANEIYLAADNTPLIRPAIESSDVEYTDADGGEMIRQRLQVHEQTFAGIIIPKETSYWDLYFKLGSFFKINHYYNIIYIQKSGELFAQRYAWLSTNLQLSPEAREDYSNFTVGFKVKNSSLYEYAENGSGDEVYANSATLPLLFAASGGEKWDTIGQTWNTIGSVWEAGDGGVQEITIASTSPVYPLWTVHGSSINPRLQNNTTDTFAVYNGTVATGQTLVVDFATGEARLDGTLVTRNISGQVKFNTGSNIVGFNSDGGSATTSLIQWNNVIG